MVTLKNRSVEMGSAAFDERMTSNARLNPGRFGAADNRFSGPMCARFPMGVGISHKAVVEAGS